jgi:hypothetical protein
MNDINAVMRAIAAVETNSGANSYPRFERSFAPVGDMFTVQGRLIQGTGMNFTAVARGRWDKWGMASACSYGPWQILYHTAADRGFLGAPWELWEPSTSWEYATKEVRRQFVKGATTIQKLADAWNSGSFQDSNVPGDYITAVTKAFIEAGGDPNAPLEL